MLERAIEKIDDKIDRLCKMLDKIAEIECIGSQINTLSKELSEQKTEKLCSGPKSKSKKWKSFM